MSKIFQAVNSMVFNRNLITNVVKGESEYFFLYKNKYKWSIAQREDETYLWYYPGSITLEALSRCEQSGDWESVDMVKYSDREIGTKEAIASFSELFVVVKEKLYRIDDVLDDIISDDGI
ncbi:hypothetical protein SAMN05443026_5852 [Burkholderia orbicola]|uniref:hypothetical protein n=1 Tax=Burkholderia cepacia complex TaxID=87882 RepID=UPI000885AB94|nr:hypothetical protein [Burkholderia cenocepacia]MBR8507385.1 hypothetical protein [Burkholderia cenocepacia]RQV63356.1 hypothetical protein DF020_00695 [Burkholderia cenocepacia]SDR54787.1 hypothetical protein SAMN05443026_5852 [Burkholderia orbicola]